MARSIDLRRELLRGIQRWQTPLPCKGLTSQTPSRQRSSRSVPNRPHIWAQAIPIEPSKALQAGGRPHMDARFRGHDGIGLLSGVKLGGQKAHDEIVMALAIDERRLAQAAFDDEAAFLIAGNRPCVEDEDAQFDSVQA